MTLRTGTSALEYASSKVNVAVLPPTWYPSRPKVTLAGPVDSVTVLESAGCRRRVLPLTSVMVHPPAQLVPRG